MGNPPRATGRPRHNDEVKRHPVGIRTTKTLKDQLVQASQASGRSVAQEIEHRLELSFMAEYRLEEALELAFGRQVAAVAIVIGVAMKATVDAIKWGQRKSPIGEPAWLGDAFAFGQVAAAINGFLASIEPEEGDLGPPPERLARQLEHVPPQNVAAIYTCPGRDALERLLIALVSPDDELPFPPEDHPTFGRWLLTAHRWLGSAAISRVERRLSWGASYWRDRRPKSPPPLGELEPYPDFEPYLE